MKLSAKTKLAWLGLALIFAGYGFLIYAAGWKVAVAIFLIQWSGNIDNKMREL